MSAFFYYLFVIPLSYLPLWISYRFSDVFYFLISNVYPYRKKVIERNLRHSFPNKSDKEIKQLRNAFYRQFCDMLIEGIKNITISKTEIQKRYVVTNPELMDELYVKNKSVLLVSAHYNNWEWMITGQQLFFKHQAVGIGMPLTNKFWDKELNTRRSRYGMKVIHAKIVKDTFEKASRDNSPIATLILSDQSPQDATKSYWMNFLNQETAVLFGVEQLANSYNQAVVFYLPKRVKRGHYELTLELLTEEPRTLNWGELTEMHTKKLEEGILVNPSVWLWSHKRWKRDVPSDIQSLKTQQREKFNQLFRNTSSTTL